MNLFLICQPNGDFYILIFNNKGDVKKKNDRFLSEEEPVVSVFECYSGLFIAIA